jgi:catechol 2,3-dioxygenase-like lactoylglutathione lyase family enzyme
MIDHTGIGVADVARSALFYDAALSALGLRRVMQLPENDGADGVGYGVDHPVFWIDRFHPHGVKQHTAFVARNRAEVDAFHASGLKAGGAETERPVSAGRTTTLHMCSIRTAIISKRSAARADAAAPRKMRSQIGCDHGGDARRVSR